MSITSDVRSYADSAREQAQARLTEVRGDAAQLAGSVMSRASVTYAELRSRGEVLTKRVGTLPGVERATATVEPYVAQLKDYGSGAAEKLEQVYAGLRKNDQVAKVITAAETAIEAVQEHVTSLLDRQPAASAAASAPAAPTKAPDKEDGTAEAKPTAKTSAAKASAAKATPAKRTTTPRTTKA